MSALAVDTGSVLINVPKLKTHNLAITTLCVKNLMGAVRVQNRHFCHQAASEVPELVERTYAAFDPTLHQRWQNGLARRLVDTAQIVRPDLNVVEGVVGRDGTGFRHGRNHALGLVIVGINMVAVDAVASFLMGFDPENITCLRLANEIGLGPNTMRDITVCVAHDGDVRACDDVSALRAGTPFTVFSSLPGLEEAK